jgi:riboflavin kinase/FMN adenylyltransferase
MKIIHSARDMIRGRRPVCVAIGFFDGVHLGHQQVIRQALADADQQESPSVVVTFDRHPATVVAPERAPSLIDSLQQRLDSLARLRVETTLLLPFDEELCRQPAEDFIRGLVSDFGGIYSICVGSTFKFGHRRQGNVELLKKLGGDMHFIVHGLASVSLDGQTVSSTRIRQAIQAGELDAAGQMLGRPWALSGIVTAGDRLGRQLGFPTANLDVAGRVLPPHGVYAVHANIGTQMWRAVLNIGLRPTLQRSEPQLRVEAHLLDFDGDLYGKELAVTFVAKLREETRFASLERLKRQIERDIQTARQCFDTSRSGGHPGCR